MGAKIVGHAYEIEEPFEATKLNTLGSYDKPRTLETHEGFTSFYEKQGSQRGKYVRKTTPKKEWAPSEW